MVMAPSAFTTDKNYNTFDTLNWNSENHGVAKTQGRLLSPKDLIRQVMKDKIAHIDVDTCEPGEEDAFYVADMGEVYRQHIRWKMNLGRVKPFYGESALCRR
jgi:ornithine decarboxylase